MCSVSGSKSEHLLDLALAQASVRAQLRRGVPQSRVSRLHVGMRLRGGMRPSDVPLTQPVAAATLAETARRLVSHPDGTPMRMSKEFPLLQPALQHLDGLVSSGRVAPHHVGLFARETSNTGARRFIVETYAGFIAANARGEHAIPNRNLYEVVRGSVPCWLFFDLDASVESNPGFDFVAAVRAFHDLFGSFCRDVLSCTYDRQMAIELGSSSPTKFSRHIIIKNLNGGVTAFLDSQDVGVVVHAFVRFCDEKRKTGDVSARHLFVQKPPGAKSAQKETSLVDLGIYTRNRSFRLPFQSKHGKPTALLPTASLAEARASPLQVFAGSMVTLVREGVPIFRHGLRGETPQPCRSSASAPGASSSSSTTCPATGPPPLKRLGNTFPNLAAFLVQRWDAERQQHEGPPRRGTPTTWAREFCEIAGLLVPCRRRRRCYCRCCYTLRACQGWRSVGTDSTVHASEGGCWLGPGGGGDW